jgi:hypothetical protein
MRPILHPGQTDPETARETADEVMSRPEFDVQQGLFGRVAEWLRELLDFQPPEPDAGGGTLDLGWLGSLLGWVVILALLGLAAFLLFRYVRLRRRGERVDDAEELQVEDATPLREKRSDAEALEAAGRWREAMLARYRDLVEALIADGRLAPVPGRTAGEYSDDLAAVLPQLAAPFDDATELFERAWYGNLPTGHQESAEFQEAAGRVLAGSRGSG